MPEKSPVKILVCYHKPAHVFKNSVLKPIGLGRALRRDPALADLTRRRRRWLKIKHIPGININCW